MSSILPEPGPGQRGFAARCRTLLGLSPIVAAALTCVFVLGRGAPAAAQGVIATGSGRAGASVAALLALIGLVIAGVSLSRSGRHAGSGRDGAIAGVVLALVGSALAVLHLATSTGGIGTGNGRGGAIVALLLGSIGLVLSRRALVRSRRAG